LGKRDIDPTAGGYPAEQYRLVDPDYRIDTPVDSRGLVDIHRHIDLVKQLSNSSKKAITLNISLVATKPY
jgi:hypothetical protein